MAKERHLTPLDRLIQRSIGKDMTMGGIEDPAATAFPLLWDWLTRSSAGVDHIKEPAKLLIRAVPGGWSLAIQDIDLNTSLEAHSGTLQGCFEALELALHQPVLPIKKYGRTMKELKKRKQG